MNDDDFFAPHGHGGHSHRPTPSLYPPHPEFPRLFAIRGARTGQVLLFQATLLQERPSYYSASPPVYAITPEPLHRPSRGDPDPEAYSIPMGPAAPRLISEVLLVGRASRHDEVFFSGQCYSTGRSLICMYVAVPIPILEFDGDTRGAWPRQEESLHRLLVIQEASPELFRAWQHRWNPDRWMEDAAREFAPVFEGGGRVAAAARTPIPTLIPIPPPVPSPPPVLTLGAATEALPRFVVEALIRHQGGTCPITMEPLTDATQAAVTDCYHVFEATALETWRVTGDGTCPVCKSLL